MFKKTAFLLTAALIASAASPTSAWSQEEEWCWYCHCCEWTCIWQGANMGEPGDYGHEWQLCNDEGGCVGRCGDMEESPEVAAFDFNTAWADISTLNPNTIQELLRAHPDHLVLNRDRVAVQMIGCANEVIGHLQLPRAIADVLVSEEGL